MIHSFYGTLIGTVILLLCSFYSYSRYRKKLSKNFLEQIKGESSTQVLSPRYFFGIHVILFVTLFVSIVTLDITAATYQYVSKCASEVKEEGPLATCFNSKGLKIYAHQRDAIKELNKKFPEVNTNFDTMLNVDDSRPLKEQEQLLVNSRLFNNVILQTKQTHFILDSGLEIKILDDHLDGRFVTSLKNSPQVQVKITNKGSKPVVLTEMNPVSVYLDNKLIEPSQVDGYKNKLNPGESIEVRYYYPEMVNPFNVYTLRLHGINYSYERYNKW